MNLLADENIDAQIVERLRADGHIIGYVAETSPSITDDAVLDRANKLQSLLMTSDKDFGELVFRLHRAALGVILIRLPGLSADLKAHIVSEVMRTHGDEMSNAFTVISPGMTRIRHEL